MAVGVDGAIIIIKVFDCLIVCFVVLLSNKI